MKNFSHKYYLVKEYMLFFMQKNKLSRRKFCKKCGIKLRDFRLIVKNSGETGIKEILKVFNFINIPMTKAFIYLDDDRFRDV